MVADVAVVIDVDAVVAIIDVDVAVVAIIDA